MLFRAKVFLLPTSMQKQRPTLNFTFSSIDDHSNRIGFYMCVSKIPTAISKILNAAPGCDGIPAVLLESYTPVNYAIQLS